MRISDDIHNYYENLLIELFNEMEVEENYDSDFVADLTCIVLNQLPPRYIRHEVDMSFYLPASERFEMKSKVKVAVQKGLEFMKANE